MVIRIIKSISAANPVPCIASSRRFVSGFFSPAKSKVTNSLPPSRAGIGKTFNRAKVSEMIAIMNSMKPSPNSAPCLSM